MTAFQLNLMLNNFDIFIDGEIVIGLIGYNVSTTNGISNRFALAPDVSALHHDTAAVGFAFGGAMFLIEVSDKTSYYISSGTVCYGVWLNWCGCPMQLYKKKIWVLWLILIPYVLLRYAMPCHAMPCHVGYVATLAASVTGTAGWFGW
uniref:Uncharacterized protein n=1 Tax=Glossina pallidipes TaxID=7398 RepID=A0A1A9ZB43_GLOPL